MICELFVFSCLDSLSKVGTLLSCLCPWGECSSKRNSHNELWWYDSVIFFVRMDTLQLRYNLDWAITWRWRHNERMKIDFRQNRTWNSSFVCQRTAAWFEKPKWLQLAKAVFQLTNKIFLVGHVLIHGSLSKASPSGIIADLECSYYAYSEGRGSPYHWFVF